MGTNRVSRNPGLNRLGTGKSHLPTAEDFLFQTFCLPRKKGGKKKRKKKVAEEMCEGTAEAPVVHLACSLCYSFCLDIKIVAFIPLMAKRTSPSTSINLQTLKRAPSVIK